MADTIQATPRNRLLGLLADTAQGAGDFLEHKDGLMPMRLLSQALGIKPVARTLNELSYDGAMGTGSGMTWKPKADTVDAAMALAPIAMAAPEAINKGAAAIGRKIEGPLSAMVNRTMARGGRGAELLQDMAQGTQSPLTVWHGSPHKFDKFDASKIGTGEGAQAYGHGLYLAESPGVAMKYQPRDPKLESKFMQRYSAAEKQGNYPAMQVFEDFGLNRTPDEVLSSIEEFGYPPKDLKAALDAHKVASKEYANQSAGALYKVDLPDEHIAKMLDWDKPLSQQHPYVRKMLEPLGYSSKQQVAQYEDDLLASLYGDVSKPLGKINDPMGSDIARGGSLFDGNGQIDKAKRLQELGIPGIRYLDGGSRSAGAGSSNFVVFPGNEDILKILERNGQPIPAKGYADGGSVSESDNSSSYNPNASFSTAATTPEQQESLAAASQLGYGTDPAERSLASKFGIIPGMTSDKYLELESKVPGANDDRMNTVGYHVMRPLAEAVIAATPIGTMRNAVNAFNALQSGQGWGGLQDFAGGLLGNFAGAQAAAATGLPALSPLISSTIKGATKGDAASGLTSGVANVANSYSASALANALGITPAQANALLSLTGGSQAVGSAVKGALSRAVQ